MTAYYNEIDPHAAAWLRELIKQGQIADGVVDERSIEDISPADLTGFTQCHFFAGIGVWSYALRLAGWPDDRPVWTGSCPCQSFSAAGKGAGFADERHLWPAWFHLIEQCKPPVIFGEQVEAAVKHGWLDLVQSDLEGSGYACGAVAFPAAGIGAPHIRQRLYFVADAISGGQPRPCWRSSAQDERTAECGVFGRLADAQGLRRSGWQDDEHSRRRELALGQGGEAGGLADDNCERRDREQVRLLSGQPRQAGVEVVGDGGFDGLANPSDERHEWGERDGRQAQRRAEHTSKPDRRPSPTNGFWGAADWLHCTDRKWRPVEPGTFPLAHGASARVGRLRGYGNAIVAPAAQAFVEGFMSL